MEQNSAFRWGWRTLKGVFARAQMSNLSLVAAGGAFFAMLSIFPALAALIALVGLFTDPLVVQEQLQLLVEFIPQDAFAVLNDQVTRLAATSSGTLGWTTGLTTLAALWSARRGMDALIQALNAIYGVPQRGGIRANLMALALTLAMVIVVTIAGLALIVIPVVIRLLTLDIFAELLPAELIAWATGWVLASLRWTTAGGVVFGGIWLIYRFAPNGPAARVPLFSAGALLAIGVWLPISYGFTRYLAYADAYSGVYGSIGAIIALLMFLYITISSVLLGAALNAELRVTPPAKPLEPAPSDASAAVP